MKNPELNQDGFLILHDGNHNERANPHPQYMGSLNYKSTGLYGSTKNQWVKVATISCDNISGSDSSASLEFKIFNTLTSSQNSFIGNIFAKIKINNSISSTPTLEIKVNNLPPSSVCGIISQNDNSKLVMDIYVLSPYSYIIFNIMETYRNLSAGYVSYYEGTINYLGALPSGQQINATSMNVNCNYITTQTNGTTGVWTKIADIILSSSPSSQSAILLINGTNTNDSLGTSYAMLEIKATLKGALGTSPVVDMRLIAKHKFKSSNFIGVITVNDGVTLKIEFYMQLNDTWENYNIIPLMQSSIDKNDMMNFYSNQPLLSSLPAGTQINAFYPFSISLTATSSGNVDNNSLFVDSDKVLKFKDYTGTVKIVNLT